MANKSFILMAIVLGMLGLISFVPTEVKTGMVYQAEQGKEAEATFAIEDAFEGAMMNALEKEIDYNAKSRGVVKLKGPTNADSETRILENINKDMAIFFKKYYKNDKQSYFADVGATVKGVPVKIEILEVKGAEGVTVAYNEPTQSDQNALDNQRAAAYGMRNDYGRMTNYNGDTNRDVHTEEVWEFQSSGNFPTVKAKVIYKFNSIYQKKEYKERPIMTHTIRVGADHSNIIHKVWE